MLDTKDMYNDQNLTAQNDPSKATEENLTELSVFRGKILKEENQMVNDVSEKRRMKMAGLKKDNFEGQSATGDDLAPKIQSSSEDKQSTVHQMLIDLLDRYHFIAIKKQQLYFYVEEFGYWKLVLPNSADLELRELLTLEWSRAINAASMTELYKWLLISAPAKDPSVFAKGRNCLNFLDCAYDWKNEEIISSRKKQYFRYVLNIKFPRKKSTGIFDNFINEALENNQDMIREFSKFVGIALSDIRDLKYVFFLFGPSNSGKSTILNAIKYVVGSDQCSALSFSQLSNEFYLSSLYGRRLNISGEISGVSTTKLDILKSLSGNDSVLGSYKFKDAFQFDNRCLLVFACNCFPKITDYMEFQSFASRMVVFPFRNIVERENWNTHLLDDLQSDARGIVDFAIRGLRRLEKDSQKIFETTEMSRCKNDYAGLYDSFSLFADDYIKIERNHTEASAEIKKVYHKFCLINQYETLHDNQWAQLLKRKFGCMPCTTTIISDIDGSEKRVRAYRGIKLKKKVADLMSEDIPTIDESAFTDMFKN